MKKLWITLLMLPVLLGLNTCTRVTERPDYHALLIEAVTDGQTESGRQLAAERNAAIARGQLDGTPVDYDELSLLARLIFAEAGEQGYSDAQRLCVGEVALNRVASPEFPDLRPSRSCAELALRLLLGERRLAPSVLYYGARRIGPVYARFYDRRLGTTYFCESVYAELYDSE